MRQVRISIALSLLFWGLCIPIKLFAQVVQYDQLYKTPDGVLHWSTDHRPVTGFGVNYTVPFAHAYRQAKNMGIDHRRAIDQDVYHFARLGLDLYRVHVWDTEISDTLGNLLDNEHLELFDYLLYRLQQFGINAVITPIAFWGNGWPEPDEATPGFAYKYGKDNCLTDTGAIYAQENYLAQFVGHVNRYTGVAYKDDPSILAFEISNEPHHRGTPEEVTAFVRRMKDAIQNTGCRKPVFYNVSHSVHLADAYYASGIDGGTFQWYPTGLGYQKELGGNMLPNVDRYAIPFDDVLKQYGSARFVYEFDAADMASGYMYPAMARSFRSAGIQLATHFSYDPTFLAPFNTEYNTHYMNLVYAPRKALSLMLCAEIFRNIPLYAEYGVYPHNRTFGAFRIDEARDLVEMVTQKKFIYTHHTSTLPPAVNELEHIAGWGHSPLVKYEGTGAYFLDKAGEGIWILEITPDAIPVDNLFGRNSPEKKLAEIHIQPWPMKLHLPAMTNGLLILGTDTEFYTEVDGNSFAIPPGKYVVASRHIDFEEMLETVDRYPLPVATWLETSCAGYVRSTLRLSYVMHTPEAECTAGLPYTLTATIASPAAPDSVHTWVYHNWRPVPVRMEQLHGYTYTATLPAEYINEGRLNYWITLYDERGLTTYPAGEAGKPGDWDFDFTVAYTTDAVGPNRALVLFDPRTDISRLSRQWLPDSRLVWGEEKSDDKLYLKITRLVRSDPENPEGPKIADYSMRHYFGDRISGRAGELAGKKTIVLYAQAMPDKPCPLEIRLVQKDGAAFGAIVQVTPGQDRYEIPVTDLRPVSAVLLPRPFPTFLPYYSHTAKAEKPDLAQAESLQIAIGPGIPAGEVEKEHEVMIGKVSLR